MAPKVTILGTGGTIAGVASSADKTTGYKSGVLSVEELVRSVPQLGDSAEIRSEQFANLGSPDMTSADLLRLRERVQEELEGEAEGVVITYGTDSLPEAAFFLELTIQSDKPVVMVGAMRPATSLSADGPMNLLCAVNLAASPKGRRRGVMIAGNDHIWAPRYTTKSHCNSVDAFEAREQGALGCFVSAQPMFYWQPSRPEGHAHFDVSGLEADKGLPDVEILFGRMDMDSSLFNAAVGRGSKGVVLAGMGAGCWSSGPGEDIARFVEAQGLAVVASRRADAGFVGGNDVYGLGSSCIGGGFLDPAKCRVLLQLALAAGCDAEAIRKLFEGANEPARDESPEAGARP